MPVWCQSAVRHAPTQSCIRYRLLPALQENVEGDCNLGVILLHIMLGSANQFFIWYMSFVGDWVLQVTRFCIKLYLSLNKFVSCQSQQHKRRKAASQTPLQRV